jgi:integrase
MQAVTFVSCLAGPMRSFVELRQLSGTDYQSQARLLSYFDRFLVAEDFARPYVQADVVQRYVATMSALAPRTRSNRVCVLRQFCCDLAMVEPRCHIPAPLRCSRSRDAHVPYVYSDAEIQAILSEALRLRPVESIRPRTFHTLFGLLYSSGIRIGEAMALDLTDVCTDSMRLHIRNGKFRKERWVPLSKSTWRVLRDYIRVRCRLFAPTADNAALFVNTRGVRLKHCSVRVAFCQVLDAVHIPKIGTDGPRVHDLRHTFAVRCVLRWYRQGLDVNAMLPALATYMGHVDIGSTQVYLDAAGELLGPVNERFHNHFQQHIARRISS